MHHRISGAVILAALTLWTAAHADSSELEVRGTVADGAGQGLAGASVELFPIASNFEAGRLRLRSRTHPDPATTARSGDGGRFRLPVPEPGLWKLVVRSRGHVPVQYQPLVVVGNVELPTAVLRHDLGAPAATREPSPGASISVAGGWREWTTAGPVEPEIDGTPTCLIEVRDADHAPLEGVLATIGAGGLPVGITGDDGRLRVPIRAGGPVAIRLTTADGRHALEELPADSTCAQEPRAVALSEAAAFEGRILDATTGKPLPGAVVWTGIDPGAFVRTGPAGRYRMTVAAAGRFWVQAEAAGYLPRAVKVSQNRRDRRLPSLALVRPAAVAGQVLDENRAPVAEAVLEAVPARRRAYFRPDRADGRSVSEQRGRFSLTGLEPGGAYLLRVESAGFASATVPVMAPDGARPSFPLTIVLRASRPVVGRVVDVEEQPIAGVEVELRDPNARRHERLPGSEDREDAPFQARSDRQGRFEIAGVPASAIEIAASKPGFAPLRVRGVEIPSGEGPFDLGLLVLTPGAALAGRVVDPEDEAIAGADVHLLTTADPPGWLEGDRFRQRSPDAVTGADGRFAFDDLLPGRPVSLYVAAAGHAAVWVRGVETPAREPLRVVLQRARTVAGRVVDEEERAIRGAEISLSWRAVLEGSSERLRVGTPKTRARTSDADGRFELSDLEPGAATIEVFAEGYVPPEPLEIEIPADGSAADLLFVLERGTAVEGRVTTSAGDPLAGVRIAAEGPAALSDAEGWYRIAGVAPGPATLVAFHPDYPRQLREVEIEPAGQVVDWTFEEGRRLGGRVVEEDGAPVPDAGVALSLVAAGESRAYSGRSAADGSFELFPVAAGRYRAEASKPGFAARPVTVTVDGSPVEGLEIPLLRGGSIAGRVAGLDFDELARVRVQAAGEAGEVRHGRVDYEGGYEITDLAPGDWRVLASLDAGQRHAQARLTLPPGGRQVRQDLEFGGGLTLSGLLLYRGEPLPDAAVALEGYERSVRRSVVSNYLGEFEFEDLDPGSFHLEVSSARELLVHNQTLALEGDRHLVLELGSARVSGRVVAAPAYQPVPHALVALRRLVDAPGVEEFLIAGGSDDRGFFELPRVPRGRYRLEARKDGYAPLDDEVEIETGLDLAGLELVLSPTQGLELVVRLASGRIPGSASVQVLDPAGRVVLQESRPLDAEGRASLPRVPAGTWELLVDAPGGAAVRTSAVAPGEPVAVVLPDAGRLRVRVPELASSDLLAAVWLLDPQHRPLRGIGPGGAPVERWPLTGGRATIDDVPFGLWTVMVSAPDGRGWASSVDTSGSADLEVTVE